VGCGCDLASFEIYPSCDAGIEVDMVLGFVVVIMDNYTI
jgi:hypothetical protein